MQVQIDGQSLNISQVVSVAYAEENIAVKLDAGAQSRLQASRAYVEKELNSGRPVYGVNTGFGAFSRVRISTGDIVQLQRNLVRSHASGVGEPLSRHETRAIMLLRANTLSRGNSGVRPAVVEKLLEFLNANVLPVIPSQGSVGASGDLAPLAHLALALIGEGSVWSVEGPRPTADVLKEKSIAPLELEAKEGLSLINGCQVMTAIGLLAAERARNLILMADVSGAMSLEALRGSRSPFDPLISASRPHPGESETARNLMRVLGEHSEISNSHVDCDKVQDPYSLRCMPAVHGSVKAAWRSVLRTLEIEANSSTDNPLVFHEAEKVLSCGNFHGQPVAMSLDYLTIALTSLMSISERRTEKLINPALSELPAFLTPNGGLNSGFMMAQVAAASLVSESKVLSHPASVDSIPTSADKEDHVSMGTIASRKLAKVVDHLEYVIAIELLAAKQGMGLLRPLKAAPGLQGIYEYLESVVPFMDEDRVISYDIEKVRAEIRSGRFMRVIREQTGELEC